MVQQKDYELKLTNFKNQVLIISITCDQYIKLIKTNNKYIFHENMSNDDSNTTVGFLGCR